MTDTKTRRKRSEDEFADWWQQAASAPGTRFVDLLTWTTEMIARQEGPNVIDTEPRRT